MTKPEGSNLPVVWQSLFTRWVKSLDSILHLETEGVVDDEDASAMKDKLLDDIIETFRSEIED